jgi:hypothetical protein
LDFCFFSSGNFVILSRAGCSIRPTVTMRSRIHSQRSSARLVFSLGVALDPTPPSGLKRLGPLRTEARKTLSSGFRSLEFLPK